MAVENENLLIQKAIDDAVKFALKKGDIKIGEEAFKKAQNLRNTDYSKGGGFEEGDIITFPKDTETASKRLVVEGKGVSIVCLLTRNGKTFGYRVLMNWFVNTVHPCDDKGEKDEELWLMHQGQPAEDARGAAGTSFDAVAVLCGKVVKVVRVRKEQCLVIDKENSLVDTKNPENSKWAFKPGTRKFYDYEYTTTEE